MKANNIIRSVAVALCLAGASGMTVNALYSVQVSDRLYIEDFSIKPGQSKLVDLWMDSMVPWMWMYDCEVVLPEGLVIEPVVSEEIDPELYLYDEKWGGYGALSTNFTRPELMSGPFAEDFTLFHMETSHNLWTDKVADNKMTFLFEGGAKIEIMGNGQYQMMQFKVKATDTFKGGDIEVCPDGFSFLTYHEFYAHEGGSSTTETTCNGEPSRARVTLDTGPSAVTDLKASGVVEGDGVYYNLMGQPMTHPTQPGIYIHNGQKVVVK